jgi:hypothetical protein
MSLEPNPVADLFRAHEHAMSAAFEQSGAIAHSGDKGDNREEILRKFLTLHLPSKYGVTKGQVFTKDGRRSHAADVIIFDRQNCPTLYAGHTSILPIEGVYGIIEVKSILTKAEFDDAAGKIESFKKLAPRDLAIVKTREYVTVNRASRPFGVVLGYRHGDNSLDSLHKNWLDQNKRIHNVDYFINLTAVLSSGLLLVESVNLSRGIKSILVDTDDLVRLVQTSDKKKRTGEKVEETGMRIIADKAGDQTFGRFFVYLLVMLNKMKLNVPDLGRYLDPDADPLISRE